MTLFDVLYWLEGAKLTLYTILHNVLSIKEAYKLHQRLKSGELDEEEDI